MSLSKVFKNPLALIFLLSGTFFVLFLIVSSILFVSRYRDGGGSKPAAALFSRGNAIGIVELKGVIMDSKDILKQLKKFEEQKEIQGVVLRLNSPGGSVAPSQEIYEAVKKYKKPLVVSMASLAASGAFYVACGAKKVYANPGTLTGSIGVIMEFANLKDLYRWAKIERYSIKTGKFKDSGAVYRGMTGEERILFQQMIDNVLVQFKTAISQGRRLPMAQVNTIADGRIFTGAQAKELKLVDSLGTIDDAIEDVAKQAKIEGKPRIVYADRFKKNLMNMLFDFRHEDDDEDSSSQITSTGWLAKILGGSDTLHAVDQNFSLALTPGIYWLWNGSK